MSDELSQNNYGVAKLSINGKEIAEMEVVTDSLKSELNIIGGNLRAAGQKNLGLPVNPPEEHSITSTPISAKIFANSRESCIDHPFFKPSTAEILQKIGIS